MERSELLNKLRSHKPTILGTPNTREHAVIIPLIENEGEMRLLFEVRSKSMRRQPGEICFPGGRVEENESPEQAALREMEEEIGVPREDVTEVTPLGILTTPFGVKLHVFFGILPQPLQLTLNPEEVEETFTVPLDFFKNNEPEIYYIHMDMELDKDFPVDDIPNGSSYKGRSLKYKENFYYYKQYVIWGLTALIINDFVERFM